MTIDMTIRPPWYDMIWYDGMMIWYEQWYDNQTSIQLGNYLGSLRVWEGQPWYDMIWIYMIGSW